MATNPLAAAAAAAAASRKLPVLAIVGTTGVGKSKLAIQLAKTFGGHVVNADSMQVYRGLDLATNKPTLAEMLSVPHHLFGFVDPAQEYSVSEYASDAEKTIADIHAKGKIPIIVGGTHYYIQSLLWGQNIIQTASTPRVSIDTPLIELAHGSLDTIPFVRDQLLAALEASDPRLKSASDIHAFAQTDTLHTLLGRVDPVMANRWHPRDYRKIRRSLEVFYTTGRPHSEWMKHQSEERQRNDSMLRYPTLVFWLHAEPSTLYSRLNARVDEMIEGGLFDEMQDMRNMMLSGEVVGLTQPQSKTSDGNNGSDLATLPGKADLYNRGILQAIGFKEFHDYFTAIEQDASTTSSTDLDRLKSVAIDDMKRATRQYARRQVTWLRNKLAPSMLTEHMQGPQAAFYMLDATQVAVWDMRVRDEAVKLTRMFLDTGDKVDPWSLYQSTPYILPEPDTIGILHPDYTVDGDTASPVSVSTSAEKWRKHTCDVCIDDKTGLPRVLNGDHEYQIHIKTRKHRMNTVAALSPDASTKSSSYRSNRSKKPSTKSHGAIDTDPRNPSHHKGGGGGDQHNVHHQLIAVLQQRQRHLQSKQ